MSLFSVTALEIAPALHLHYQPNWSIGRLCCCGGSENEPPSDSVYYVDRKLKLKLANGHQGDDGDAASHARLKLVVIESLLAHTRNPFTQAERVFGFAAVSWNDPEPLYRETLVRVDKAFERVKMELLTLPLDFD